MLDEDLINFELDCLPLDYFLLQCILGHKSVYKDLLLLPYPVGSVHRLEVDLGVEVGVVQDDMVRRRQVEAKPSCTGRYQEDGFR